MLDFALKLQHQYENSSPIDRTKQKGQVFTPPETARFMASLFSEIPKEYRLLDPGAGIGVLTTAFCERLLTLPSPDRIGRQVKRQRSEMDAVVLGELGIAPPLWESLAGTHAKLLH